MAGKCGSARRVSILIGMKWHACSSLCAMLLNAYLKSFNKQKAHYLSDIPPFYCLDILGNCGSSD